MTPDQSLRALLRITAAAASLAVVAVYMPRSWMVFSHQSLGLGPFPDGPIAEYLARSASGLYAMLGGLLWIVSMDIARYRSIIRYVAIAMLIFGCTLLGVDIQTELPLWWALVEGPSTMLLGIVVLVLLRQGAGITSERLTLQGASEDARKA